MIARELVAYLKQAFHRLDEYEHISHLSQGDILAVEKHHERRGILRYARFLRRVRDLKARGRLDYPAYVREYYRPQLDGMERPALVLPPDAVRFLDLPHYTDRFQAREYSRMVTPCSSRVDG